MTTLSADSEEEMQDPNDDGGGSVFASPFPDTRLKTKPATNAVGVKPKAAAVQQDILAAAAADDANNDGRHELSSVRTLFHEALDDDGVVDELTDRLLAFEHASSYPDEHSDPECRSTDSDDEAAAAIAAYENAFDDDDDHRSWELREAARHHAW